jgi:diguanylate cyclase (GGDEF)-like protein
MSSDRGEHRLKPGAGHLWRLALVCAAYFGLAKAGLAFAFENQSVTAIWPPTGLALAAVLIWGFRMWPGIAAGAFLANITTAGSVPTVMAIATGNTLEALVGAYLLLRVAHFRPSLERVRDVLALVLFGAVLSTMISATIGVASLSASGLVPDGQLASTWRVWWFGDVGGDLLFAPVLLILASWPHLERRPWIRGEAVGLLAVLVGVDLLGFATEQKIFYMIFPVLFWIAYRYLQPGTAIAGLITSGMAVYFAGHGHGPFTGGSEDTELLRAQIFVGMATITGLLVAALAAERRDAERELRHRAEHDPLTGLVNSSRFTEELKRCISYNARYGGGGAVMVLDLDHFKRVNDTLGHTAGDELLARVAHLLRRRLRETDVVGRWGGDEFTVLLPQTREEDAVRVATDLLEMVPREAAIVSGGQRLALTVSIGVAPFGDGDGLEPEQVLGSADAAMYQAKATGRDRVEHSELGWKRAGADRANPAAGPDRRAAPGR